MTKPIPRTPQRRTVRRRIQEAQEGEVKPVTPDAFRRTKYPAMFCARRVGVRWVVFSLYADNIYRKVCGPYWRKITALRIASEMTTHFRNGVDIGERRHHRGGARIA